MKPQIQSKMMGPVELVVGDLDEEKYQHISVFMTFIRDTDVHQRNLRRHRMGSVGFDHLRVALILPDKTRQALIIKVILDSYFSMPIVDLTFLSTCRHN
jgi:hypothetical protein